MRYLSVCAGIEAATVAWHPIGWEPVLFSEIERFPRAVLKHRQRARDARHGVRPGRVPLWGDFTTLRPRHLRRLGIEPVFDVLVGGTPCQSFSVAGLRKGMDDPRGNLALAFLILARRFRPCWLAWENVPGVLSSNGGRDFGAFLGGLAELGYGFAYRVLDAQFFGVPQRRRRVFVVGYLGDWRRAAAVLFERHSLSGNPPPSREAGERAAPTLAARTRGSGGLGTDFDCDGGLIHAREIAPAFTSNYGKQPDNSDTDLGPNLIAHTLRADGFDASEDGTGRGTPLVPIGFTNRGFHAEEGAETLRAGSHGALPMVAFAENSRAELRPMAVRRISPREAERLQGFPDDYTRIPYRGKPADACPDGPRYKALGNSMAVPVMRWIGERIAMVEALEDPDGG